MTVLWNNYELKITSYEMLLKKMAYDSVLVYSGLQVYVHIFQSHKINNFYRTIIIRDYTVCISSSIYNKFVT